MNERSNQGDASDPRSAIKAWWEDPQTVSLRDQNLRQLETNFVLSCLNGDEVLADLGCGDCVSTVEYARKVKHCFALEQSQTLYDRARKRIDEAGLDNVTLVRGDLLALENATQKFNVVVTQRVIINFMTWEEQQQVLRSIAERLEPGGLYIALENTFEGFEELNSRRRAVGLPNIVLHDWHNYFLFRDRFLEFMGRYFVLERTHNFNLYYFLTRVFVNLFANFEGFGAGAKVDPIFDRADAAARELYEKFGDQVEFKLGKGDSMGPIQGWVFRRSP